jgi:hypothetical protein
MNRHYCCTFAPMASFSCWPVLASQAHIKVIFHMFLFDLDARGNNHIGKKHSAIWKKKHVVLFFCNVFHFLALYFIFWHCISFFGTVFHFLELYFIFWNCISFFGTVLHFLELYFKKIALLLANQNWEIFSCILLIKVWTKSIYFIIIWLFKILYSDWLTSGP